MRNTFANTVMLTRLRRKGGSGKPRSLMRSLNAWRPARRALLRRLVLQILTAFRLVLREILLAILVGMTATRRRRNPHHTTANRLSVESAHQPKHYRKHERMLRKRCMWTTCQNTTESMNECCGKGVFGLCLEGVIRG